MQQDVIINDFLNDTLNHGLVEIVFDKVDGTRRIMRCTLNEDYINEHVERISGEDKAPPTKERKQNPNLVVFDAEKNDWRSIRPDSIISFRALYA